MIQGSSMSQFDRRVAKRYPVELEAGIQCASGEDFSARVVNLSISGLQLEISNQIVPNLIPNQEREFKLDTIPLIITIALPDSEQSVCIKIGVVYLRRVSMEDSMVGCRFETFYDSSAAVLESFIKRIENKTPYLGMERAEVLYLT